MELLTAEKISHQTGDADLLGGLDLTVTTTTRLGVVGPNGSGKSTLLAILAGATEPRSGKVTRAPGVRVAFLEQHTARDLTSARHQADTVLQYASTALSPAHAAEAQLRAIELEAATASANPELAEAYALAAAEFERHGGYSAEAGLLKRLATFGFAGADLGRELTTLSPGELQRLALATALASRADVILLDEPTNHLDLRYRSTLAVELNACPNALVIVSHDRAILDASTNKTGFLTGHGAANWRVKPGSYTTAREALTNEERATNRRAELRQHEADRLDKIARELAQFGHKAHRRKKVAVRQRDRLLTTTAPSITSQKQARLVTAAATKAASTERLLTATHLRAPPLERPLDLSLDRGDRIAIVGANGSGKSTLLNLLAGTEPSVDPHARLVYLEGLKLRYVTQLTRGVDPDTTLWQQAIRTYGAARAGSLLAGAGIDATAWSRPSTDLSGGERARAGLALAFAEPADLWLLDEPTNDLDLGGVEALQTQLQKLLDDGDTALVLASHDRRLIESVASEVWGLEDGALVTYASVDAYLAGTPSRGRGRQPTESAPARTREQDGTYDGPPQGSAHEPVPFRAQGQARAEATTSATTRAPNETLVPRPLDTTAAMSKEGASLGSLVDDLETERSYLISARDERTGLTDRERARVNNRLADLEAELMGLYAASLPPPAPAFAVREPSGVVYGDELPSVPNATRRVAFVTPYPCTASAPDLDSVATAALASLTSAAPLAGCLPAWLELRLLPVTQGTERPSSRARKTDAQVAHLALHPAPALHPVPARECPLPYALSELVNAATWTAFTRLGATTVQLHHPGSLPGSLLHPAGDGWWQLTLDDFLTEHGWRR